MNFFFPYLQCWGIASSDSQVEKKNEHWRPGNRAARPGASRPEHRTAARRGQPASGTATRNPVSRSLSRERERENERKHLQSSSFCSVSTAARGTGTDSPPYEDARPCVSSHALPVSAGQGKRSTIARARTCLSCLHERVRAPRRRGRPNRERPAGLATRASLSGYARSRSPPTLFLSTRGACGKGFQRRWAGQGCALRGIRVADQAGVPRARMTGGGNRLRKEILAELLDTAQ